VVVLVATVGFDEKFVLRAVMRYADSLKRVYLVTATPVDERVARAVKLVEEFVNRVLKEPWREVKLELVEVDVRDFFKAVAELRRRCFEYGEATDTYVVNLSGGMRALVLALLAAFVISGRSGEVEVELENFSGVVRFGAELFRWPGLGDYDRRIIRSLAQRGRATYRELLADTGLPRATLFRTLKSLRLRGLVKAEVVGRTSYYSLTEVGRAYA
jgi:CRISPR-associated protein Csa3